MTQIAATLVSNPTDIAAPEVDATIPARSIRSTVAAFAATLAIAGATVAIAGSLVNAAIDRHYEAQFAEFQTPPTGTLYAQAIAAGEASEAEAAPIAQTVSAN